MTAPKLKTPPGACDCHMHIFDSRFPLAEKARRKEHDAPVSEYREVQRRLGLERLTRGGIRGVRFRMLDTPELPWEMLGEMAARVAAFGWHIQFQMDGRY